VLTFWARESVPLTNFTILVQNARDEIVLRLSTHEMSSPFRNVSGGGQITCALPALRLLPGTYHLLLAASIPPAFEYLDYVEHVSSFQVVESDIYGTGKVPPSGVFFVHGEWRLTALGSLK
jgi:hypothetical protein